MRHTDQNEPTDAELDDTRRQAPVYQTGLHWIALVGPAIVAAALIGVGTIVVLHSTRLVRVWERPPFETGWAGIVIIIVGILSIGRALLRRDSTQLTLTDQRVTVSSGILQRQTLDVLLSKVESIEVDQGMWGRLLDFGSITVRGTGGTPEPVATIAHPLEFRRQVQRQVEQQLTAPPRPSPSWQRDV